MKRGNKYKAHLLALAAMLMGSSLVFGAVLAMNRFSEAPAETTGPSAITFQVEPKKPKKDQEIKKRPPKPKKPKQQPRPLAPPPDLGTSIGGIAIDMPNFEPADLAGVTDSILGNIGDVAMTEDAVDSRPVPRMRGMIEYPPRARANNVTGYVTLSLLVGSDGRVKNYRVIDSKPAGVFDQAAVDSVQGWVFEPATYKGRDVEVWAKQTIRFDLQ